MRQNRLEQAMQDINETQTTMGRPTLRHPHDDRRWRTDAFALSATFHFPCSCACVLPYHVADDASLSDVISISFLISLSMNVGFGGLDLGSLLAKLFPTPLALSASAYGAWTKVSPETVWGDAGTKFLHPKMVMMLICTPCSYHHIVH